MSVFGNTASRGRVLLVGDLLADVWWQVDTAAKNVEHATVALVSAPNDRQVKPGGVGIVAEALARSGFSGVLFSTLGLSAEAQRVYEYIRAEYPQLDLSGVKLTSDFTTPVKTRYVNVNGHILVRHDAEILPQPPGAQFTADDIVPCLRAPSEDMRCAVVSDYGKGCISAKTRRDLVATIKAGGLPVYVDAKPAFLLQYAGADIIKINRKEFDNFVFMLGESVGGHSAIAAVADKLRTNLLIVTDGASGVWWKLKSESAPHFTATPANYVSGNCVGAGDTFLAGLVLGLSERGIFNPRALTPDDVYQVIQIAMIAAGQRVRTNSAEPFAASQVLAEASKPKRQTQKLMQPAFFIKFAQTQKAAGRRVVFTNGCFDLMHAGHLNLLNFAKEQGDVLIVAVDADTNVRRLKGEDRPVHDEQTRAGNIAALELVDAVCLFTEADSMSATTLRDLITAVQPDVLVKGAEYADKVIVGAEAISGCVALCPMTPAKSTTFFVNKMKAVKA